MDNRGNTPPMRPKHSHSSSSITSTNAAPQASSSKAPRGNTLAASRSAAKLVDDDKSSRPGSRDSFQHKMMKKSEENPKPSRSEEQLKALRSDFDSLRGHLTCKICDRLLYQPFTISCGHTYCYICLGTWFTNNKARKTCPDCRILVKEAPAPNYVIRDMVSVFIARAELLPPGETIEEHKKWQQDEAIAVQKDKENKDIRTGGLFKGCFSKTHGLPSLQVIRDAEDGVERCPICTWELEDGGCPRCGLIFDEAGQVSWGDSFSGFSDMDEMSEHDTEDLDAEMDMEDLDFGGDYGADYGGYDEAMEAWGEYLPDQGPFMMRRFLESGAPSRAAQVAFARMRPITHSQAGSRRSYTQSIISDMYGDEMDTVEEEDEEDSEMNDFIDDGVVEASSSPNRTSSTLEGAPRPSGSMASRQSRARRVVESETSSVISSAMEEDDEDEEDQGPIRRGQRNRNQARLLERANGPTRPHVAPSVTSTDISTDEHDEESQALLRAAGWQLQHDDDVGAEDEDEDQDDSDTGTTVGWEPLANSNDRSRMGGSLTPTADQLRPSAPIRSPSRTSNVRALNASRGLRRRSSTLPASAAYYEDGEADDDDSDQDGEVDLAMNALQTRRSQAQIRQSGAFSNPVARFISQEASQGDAADDPDTDENSDHSQPGSRHRNPRMQWREYDPRISWMFAAHQQALQQHQMADTLIDVEQRAITPIVRPRTRNGLRNRPSPAQVYSPFAPPTRLRTPLMNGTSNVSATSRIPVSPPRRNVTSPFQPSLNVGNPNRFDRSPSLSTNSTTSTILIPSASTNSSQSHLDTSSQTQSAGATDVVDRPQSRVSSRPGSATGRRSAAGIHQNMGLHAQGSVLPPFPVHHGNPWAAFVQARVRQRNSRQILRDQTSTATLRPTSSRANIRDVVGNTSQGVRPQSSRINLRPQQSRRQLNSQASTRTLRASEHARPPPSPNQNTHTHTHTHTTGQAVTRRVPLTQDERDSRARELIETRRRALGQPSTNPARTNPFNPGFQRPVIVQQPTMTQHVRSNSNESMQSTNSSGTTQGAPGSPILGRRRSSRSIDTGQPSGSSVSLPLSYMSPVTAANYYGPGSRPGSMSNTSVSGGYEAPPMTIDTMNSNPMMARSLI